MIHGQEISLQITNLQVCYGETVALEIPSLTAHGNIISVIGHNGSGKSTLLKSILNLLPKQSGTIEIAKNQLLSSLPLRPEQHFAFSPENGAIFSDLPVEAYLRLWCRIKQQDANYYRKDGRHIVDCLQLKPLFRKLGRELSKGQRRRVQLGVGFLTTPTVFLVDEPFDGLDVSQSHALASILEDAANEMSFILSSHQMDLVERLSDSIILLKDGHVEVSGTREEVCESLCRFGFLLSNGSPRSPHFSELLPQLRTAFDSCFITKFGNQLVVTGNDITEPLIGNFLQAKQLSDINIKQISPSLRQAMSYHLFSREQNLG